MQNNRIKTGLIGLGRAGVQMHLYELDRFASLFQLTACCDVLPDRVENVRSRYPDAAGYTDPDAFFADPDVELVCIATPSRLHVQFARKALEAGKIVFLEKPFALSEAGLEQLRQLDKMYPGKLYLRHNRRFEACYNHVMELMASGIIGSVTEVKLRRLRHRFRDDWQTRLDCGGGQLNNWAPHLIDQSLHLLGSELESVWSDMRRVAARGDAEDHIKLLFRGRNGRIIDLEISDGVPVGEPVITVYGTDASEIRIASSDATIAEVEIIGEEENSITVKVTGKKIGNAILTATAGNITATCNITVVDKSTGIENVVTGNTAVEGIYNINGMRLNSLQKGLNIIKMSNGTTKKVMVK